MKNPYHNRTQNGSKDFQESADIKKQLEKNFFKQTGRKISQMLQTMGLGQIKRQSPEFHVVSHVGVRDEVPEPSPVVSQGVH